MRRGLTARFGGSTRANRTMIFIAPLARLRACAHDSLTSPKKEVPVMQTTTATGTTPETLKSLLQGEMSAVETYEKALTKVNGAPEGEHLRQIWADHNQAVSVLRDLLIRHKGEMPSSSGMWGAFAKTVQATANLLGDTTAIKTLKEGEEHGIKDYEAALNNPAVTADVKAVSRDLRMRCEGHIPVLDAMIARQ
jgi:demethoxyubiquinone hydroxylase (CLK1/Coq7/Cat5 family)